MKKIKYIPILLAFIALALFFPQATANAFDHSHGAYTELLSKYIIDGRVDYKSFLDSKDELVAYLDDLASVSEDEFETWTDNQKISFWINLYNAHTIRLILNSYPVGNIRGLGIPLLGPWAISGIKVFEGKKISLDHIEHKTLRRKYKDPRYHFALVCAAKSCPPLRYEAYTPDRLDEQLNDQGRWFMSESKKNRLDTDKKVMYLSSIMSWYRGDFPRGNEAMIKYMWQFFDSKDTAGQNPEDYSIKHTSYDWSINQA